MAVENNGISAAKAVATKVNQSNDDRNQQQGG
jgi:hypothetical protein